MIIYIKIMICYTCLKIPHKTPDACGMCDNCDKLLVRYEYRYCPECSERFGKCEDCGKRISKRDSECSTCYKDIIDGSKITCVNCKENICRLCEIEAFRNLWFPCCYLNKNFCLECIKRSHENFYSYGTGCLIGAFLGILFHYATLIH